MNSGATAERVYDRLKARILSGAFRPGERLDPAVLAVPLAASVTPVRDALNRMTGEMLVETRAGGGFHMPPLDEPALRDRYGWSCALLLLALREASSARQGYDVEGDHLESHADRTADLFVTIARRTGNADHIRAVQGLNDRLHAVRLVEEQLLPDIAQELTDMVAVIRQGSTPDLRRLVRHYHVRRVRRAAQIVRALYRGT